jgi:hypothetical protein
MPFQYTFRADDITTWDATTRDLIENRDRELELSLINLNGANPIGGIAMWAGSIASIPANYIWCDGSSYPTSTYPELFAAINYFYGGSGANFNVPYITIPQTAIFDSGRTTSTTATGLTQSTGHVHTLTSPQSSGHTHNFNQTGNTSSSGHTHTLGASTGNGGVDHFHGGNTNSTSSTFHTHAYFKPNSGSNTTTGAANVIGSTGHTHDIGTGLATAFNHAHNAAANVNATNADTGHVHNASTIANSNADTAHTHTANATTADTAHKHDIVSHGVIFIIRYQ